MAGILTAAVASTFSGVTADPYFEYTTLLLPGNGTNGAQNNTFLDGSTNNFTITRNGNTTRGTFSPFSQTGWGGAFNTSTTYLTVTDTANLRFGSSNFTIEAWVYRNASGATQTIASKGASTPTGWVFQISSADKLVFTDTSTSITGTTSIAANTWTYIAVVRSGTGANQTTLYVNGTSDGTGTSATNFNQTSNMLIGADRSTTNFANGYISNLRLSNTNRTISSTPTTALTADANTIFLSLNINRFQYTDSTAVLTNITATGSPSVVPFSPFNPTSAWSASTVGGSGYFDGTGDYLTISSSPLLTMGTSDFTFECWTYITGSIASNYALFGTEVNDGILLRVTGGTLGFFAGNGSGWAVSGTGGTLTAFQWYHIALTRNGSNWTLWLNGQSQSVTSGTGNITGTAGIRIGRYRSGDDHFMNGYITNSRIIKGTALYTANFTPPTAPLTAITNTSLLLNFTNSGIYDATAKNVLETVGNAQVSTTQSKWSPTSMYFDGTGDYLLIPSNELLAFGTGDFTIEMWVYWNNVSSAQTLFDFRPNATVSSISPYIELASSGTLNYFVGGAYRITTSAVTATSWTHVALSRSGTSTKIFINGTQSGSTYTDSNSYVQSGVAIGFNRNNAGVAFQYMNGYIQDLRITKGYARYTANFTPPTAAFPVQ